MGNSQATSNDGSCTYGASGCACSGQKNSDGNGGSDCSGGYCYTAIGACADGQSSSYLSNQEYSYQACSNPSTNPTTTVYGCTDSSATNYNSQATSNDGSCTYAASGCVCSGQKNSNGGGGSACSSGWCYTAIGACTDGLGSSMLSNQEYSDLAC